jgi:N-acetyl-alpha-D-muramate 1-phosphate uridylyltransferase
MLPGYTGGVKNVLNLSAPSPLAQALLLAAGRGERMRPLTDDHPKPMLRVHAKPLMQWVLERMKSAGLQKVLINTAWLGEQIPSFFGSNFDNLSLYYSMEGQDFGRALETAGGIVRALPWMDDVFWVAAGDVFAPDFSFEVAARENLEQSPALAHIWLVPNPSHNMRGDFGLNEEGLALNLTAESELPRYTFSTIGLYKRAFFEQSWCTIPAGNANGIQAPLAAMLRAGMDAGCVRASLYTGRWVDVGTPERLNELNATA